MDYEVQMADEVKIRVPPKVELDEKGRPVKPTAKKDPKDPDRNLWGVQGSKSDLHTNQWVAVTFARTISKEPRVLATIVFVGRDVPER